MPTLNIKPTHKSIKNYYTELKTYAKIGAEHEGAVRIAFQNLLQQYLGRGSVSCQDRQTERHHQRPKSCRGP